MTLASSLRPNGARPPEPPSTKRSAGAGKTPARARAGRNGDGAAVALPAVANRLTAYHQPAPTPAPQSADAAGLDPRDLLAALAALKRGDFSAHLRGDLVGLDGKIADAFNDVVEMNRRLAAEIERVSNDVGRQGIITQRAAVGPVGGAWASQIGSINALIGNLVHPISETSRVIGAVAKGDLSQSMSLELEGHPLEGEFRRTAQTVNTMVSQLASFAAEVTRVAREVGTEGKLGGQADVKGVSGTWKDLTSNVNLMASNLTNQVRNIAAVTTAVATGDLSKKITVDVRGEILELKETINTMVDQLNSFASEVTRVAREVGTEGKLGGQANVRGVAGTWKDLTDSVNSMASNLTSQVRNIAAVTTAVATGDLSKKITVDVRGEILELKETINTMVDQLNSFASEVTRVAREVGTEGKLGGQAEVKGVAGTWKDLTDSVNSMASNLTSQVRNIAAVTTAVATGDLSKKITVDVRGEILELKETINTMVDQLNSFASEVTRVAREVGTEGKLGGQANVRGVAGTWKDLTDSVNSMASNLTSQVRNIAAVTTAVATGDLSKKITVDVRGEILELKETINTMVDQLNSFASEVTRVAREVGTEGKLGGQAEVKGVAGTWKDLTDNVNSMAVNLTNQVRGIAKVVTAVAQGDLKRKLTVDAKGEIAALADTINGMIDTLATFAAQVTTVAREVGVEGKLGGQANVPGAAGTWNDLTDNVNRLAANLTTQVRAIADVATAVTRGDLTRSIQVEARGEVAALKDNINEMIRNLKDTTLKNSEQDWLKTNLAKFSRMLQGQKDLLTVGRLILSELAPVVEAQQAVFFTVEGAEHEDQRLRLLAGYALSEPDNVDRRLKLGEGLVGQCALEQKKVILSNVPNDYVRITSGLGGAAPLKIIVLPILFEGKVKALLELASFGEFNSTHLAFLDQLTESIGIVINTIEANMRTEDLLKQSQSLARELQSQQQELQQTNQQLAEKAKLLAEQNAEVERKNREVEQARQALEEKATQLALTSKYKSEFLANMSHELRTPLNSLLILSDQLSRNADSNLTPRQVEFACTIHSSGNDLLTLINDILDLSKVESGTVVLDIGEIALRDLAEYVERTFRHVADSRQLGFELELARPLPRSLHTDVKRLQQIVKNLLSNAFKFTERGKVSFHVARADSGWSADCEALSRARQVLAISVRDTGVGIPSDKHQIIFEAFQQADGSTSRKHGGTGLGLAISRELARLLGGEIRLTSQPGQGSTFTLYLPASYSPGKAPTQRPAPEPPPAAAERNARAGAAPAAPDDERPGAANNLDDDRDTLRPGDESVLIVENDARFARALLETARQNRFKAVIASRGASALTLAGKLRPSAITLDVNLPDMDGWRVLGGLKDDVATRHIPVHIIADEDHCPRGIRLGALGALPRTATLESLQTAFRDLREFIQRPSRRLLVLHPVPAERARIEALAAAPGVETQAAANAREALLALRQEPFDCAVVSLDAPDLNLADFTDDLRSDAALTHLPLIVYSTRLLRPEEELRLKRLTENDAVIDVRSPERLLDETMLFLHRPAETLAAPARRIVEELHQTDAALEAKKVLIVDDDVRNIFAMTSVLEPHKMRIMSAETGQGAIALLETTPDIDVVLMDIMMPDLDGCETIRAIRRLPRFRALPIIALTAKAMKGDREKCLDAGASDYVSKPVDISHMLRLLRAWLHR